jgi:hypothetical protein
MIKGHRKETCINGHPRIEENLEGNSSCVLCRRINTQALRKSHPEARREEIAYRAAKNRCDISLCPSRSWKYYGGKGIEFRFKSFQEFLDAVGPHPGKGYSLDRIDGEGHYEAGNVRWATASEQQKNRSYIRYCTDVALLAEVKRRGLLAKAVSLLQESVAKETI